MSEHTKARIALLCFAFLLCMISVYCAGQRWNAASAFFMFGCGWFCAIAENFKKLAGVQ